MLFKLSKTFGAFFQLHWYSRFIVTRVPIPKLPTFSRFWGHIYQDLQAEIPHRINDNHNLIWDSQPDASKVRKTAHNVRRRGSLLRAKSTGVILRDFQLE